MVLVHSTTTRDFIVHNHMTWFKGHDCTLSDALRVQWVSADSACGDGLEWTQHCLFAVLLTVLPFCLCLSLRPHPHCGECHGGDGGSGRLGEGGPRRSSCVHIWPWNPRLQTTGNQAPVIHREGQEPFSRRVLGQHLPMSLLVGAGSCPLWGGRGQCTYDGETILAKRYVHFLTTWNWTSVLWCLHSNDAHQYSLAYLCSNCILHAWILYLSVHVPIVTHDHNHIMVAMQETWFTTTHL